jgi:hypothetical protein
LNSFNRKKIHLTRKSRSSIPTIKHRTAAVATLSETILSFLPPYHTHTHSLSISFSSLTIPV